MKQRELEWVGLNVRLKKVGQNHHVWDTKCLEGQLADLDRNLDECCCEDVKSYDITVCCICHFWFLFQYHRLFICFHSSHKHFLYAYSISLVILFCFLFLNWFWHCIGCVVVFLLCKSHTALCSHLFARVPQQYVFIDANFMIWYLHLHFHCLLCILMVLGMNLSTCLIVR